MAINPLARLSNFDVPNFPLSAARADPSVFSNLASLGDAIGERRERSELGQIFAGATDASGNLDLNKAYTALALSGRDPSRLLALAEAKSRAQEAQTYRQQNLDIASQGRDIERDRLKIEQERAGRPTITVKPGSNAFDPGATYSTDPRNGQTTVTPLPSTIPQPPPPPVRPQSALPGGPSLAMANPEEAPPYQVAGPPMPPPQQPAQATPPIATRRPEAVRPPATEGLTPEQDAWIEQYVPPTYRSHLRGIIDYSRDPYKVGDKKEQEFLFDYASRLAPGWSPDEFGRREKGKVGVIGEGEKKELAEQAGKFNQVLGFNQNFDDNYTIPGIAGKLGAGALAVSVGESSPASAAKLYGFFQNRPGVTEQDALKAVNFWQGYKRYVNVVRNEQFGASLTPSEQRAFAEADISPGMDPRVIRSNLDTQQGILRSAMSRRASGLLAEGVPADRIEARLGVPLSALEAPAAKPAETKGSQFDERSLGQYRASPVAALERAQKLLKGGADPARVRDLLNQVDPSLPGKLGL